MASGAATKLFSFSNKVQPKHDCIHTPYMEQQLPCGQLPQTVLPLPAPHVPSVVTFPVGAAAEVEVGLPKMGS